MRSICLILTMFATLAGVTLAQGLPSEKKTLADIRSALNQKKTWAEVKLYNRWELERDKALPHQPFDMAKHPFSCRTAKDKKGVYTEYKGLAIYVRSGPDSWLFNRLFFFEDATRMVGAKEPSRDDLFRIAYEGLRTNAKTRAWGTVRSDSIVHVHSIKIPKKNEFKRTAKKMEFLAEIVFDEAQARGRDTGVVTKSATFRVTAVMQGKTWVMRNARRQGEFKETGFRAVPKQTLRRAKSLADVDLDSMYGKNSLSMEAPKLPTTDEIRKAFVAYYNRDAKHFDKLLGSNKAGSITEIESVEPEPFQEGDDVDPADFFLRLKVQYRMVTGRRNHMKLVRAERRYQARFKQEGGTLALTEGRPVPSTERELEVLLADNARALSMKTAKAILAEGKSLEPTGGSKTTAAGTQSGSAGEQPSTEAGAATPTADEIVGAFKLTIDHSPKNLDAVLGRDMSKKVIDIEKVTPNMQTLKRVDRERVQVTVTMVYTWKRFDNILLRSQRQYDIVVKARSQGRYSVTGSKERGRERELGKANSDRAAVAAMPLYVAKKK